MLQTELQGFTVNPYWITLHVSVPFNEIETEAITVMLDEFEEWADRNGYLKGSGEAFVLDHNGEAVGTPFEWNYTLEELLDPNGDTDQDAMFQNWLDQKFKNLRPITANNVELFPGTMDSLTELIDSLHK